MNDPSRKLPLVNKNKMSALQKGKEIAEIIVKWRLIQSLNDRVESIDEVLLLDGDRCTCSYFYYLEDTKQPCENIGNAILALTLWILLQLELEELTKHVDQVPNDLNVDELSKLWNTQEHTLQKR